MMCYDLDRINKYTLFAATALIIYRLLLDLSYLFVISKSWGYLGLTLDPSVLKCFESYVLTFVCFLCMPQKNNKLSTIMIWVLVLFAYIPMLTLFALKNESRIFTYGVSGYWIIIMMFARMPNLSFIRLYESKFFIYSFSTIILISVCSLFFKSFGFAWNFNLAQVYEVRAQFATKGIPLVGYFVKWVCYVINPLLFSLFWIQKRWVALGAVIFIQLYIFSCAGHKTFIFAFFFVGVFFLIAGKKYSLVCLTAGLAIIVLLGIISNLVIGDLWIPTLFTRRLLFTQPKLYYAYYDFFSQNPKIYLSVHAFFNSLIDYPYDIFPPAKMMGDVLYGKIETSANTGLVGDAYMNFGYIGLFMWAVITGVIIKLIDSLSSGIDIRLASACIAMPMLSLINSALLTNILTHGLGVALLFLYLASSSKFKLKQQRAMEQI